MAHILKKIRHDNKMTQFELAEKLGVSRGAIALIESGKNKLSRDLAQKISKIFNISLDYLLNAKATDDYNFSYNIDDNVTNKNEIGSNLEKYNIEYKIRKLNRLYQRLIDIKLMNNKVLDKDIENNLLEYTEEFSNLLYKYDSDLLFTRTKLKYSRSKDNYQPKNINSLSNIEEYNNQLNSVLKAFEDAFFDGFKSFYNRYMEDWYNSLIND